jgi:hypothetical protein
MLTLKFTDFTMSAECNHEIAHGQQAFGKSVEQVVV